MSTLEPAREPTSLAEGETATADPEWSTLVLCATLTAATVGQGAFHSPTRWIVALGIAIVAALIIRSGFRDRWARVDVAKPLGVAAVAFAAWAVLRGAMTSNGMAGVQQAGLVAALAVVFVAAQRFTDADRGTLTMFVPAVGLITALSSWAGVALRADPWAVEGATTWRGAATLTYPNAAAAVLVASVLVHVGRSAHRSARSAPTVVVTTVLLAGFASTQSRGGVISLVVGFAVLAALTGGGRVATVIAAPTLGAGVAFCGLAIGLDADGERHVAAASLGIVAGVAIALVAAKWPPRLVAGIVGAGLVTLAAVLVADGRFSVLSSDRLRLTPGARAGTNRAALDVWSEHLLGGVGPGNLVLRWTDGDDALTTGLVHNEYLQVAAELGVVGLLLLLALLGALAAHLWRLRPISEPAAWSSACAVAVAFAAHSALDFLWRIVAIPLLVVIILASIVPRPLWSKNPSQRAEKSHE